MNPNKEALKYIYDELLIMKNQAEKGKEDYSKGYCDAMKFAIGSFKFQFPELAEEFEKEAVKEV